MTEQERRERSKSFTPEDEITFNMLDSHTVDRLRTKGDIKLPKKKINVSKDEQWNTKQMTSKLLQGILNGDSIPKIANGLIDVIGNNKASAMRNARTMVTNAECRGRQDSYEELADQGVIQKKVWIATPDDRTRESHIEVDGEEVDIDQAFSNGLMYPGDPNGNPEEVWNCRCSIRTHIVGFRKADGSISEVNYNRDITMHDDQMEALKQEVRHNISTLKGLYEDNVKSLSSSEVIARFIDEDSYVNNKDYDEAFHSVRDISERQKSIIDEIDNLESELSKMEAIPKPKEEWTAEDKIKSMLGEKPMIQSEEARLLEKRIDELWKDHGGLSGIVTRNNDIVERLDKKNYIEQAKKWDSTKPVKTDETSFLGFSTRMGIKEFDDDLANGIGYIAEMSPKEYLERCAYDIFDTTYESTVLGAETASILKYTKQMSEGVEFDMGYLDYKGQRQEGRHRAMAAELLGIEKIPVYIRGRR